MRYKLLPAMFIVLLITADSGKIDKRRLAALLAERAADARA